MQMHIEDLREIEDAVLKISNRLSSEQVLQARGQTMKHEETVRNAVNYTLALIVAKKSRLTELRRYEN